MKKCLLTFIGIVSFSGCQPAQEVAKTPEDLFREKVQWQVAREPEPYRRFNEVFTEIYNRGAFTELPSVFSDEFKENTNVERMIEFLSSFRDQNGTIVSTRFKFFDTKGQRRDKQDLAVYLATFSGGSWWDLRFGVNEESELTRILILDNNFNEDLPLVRNATPMMLPFDEGEEWTVLWGGDTEEENYHVTSRAQKNAFDFVIRHPFSHKSHRGPGMRNDDYYAWGKAVHSPCDGVVAEIIGGVEDNIPGTMNPDDLTGNTIVIKTSHDEYLLLAHLQNGSTGVSVGDRVETGQFLGLCGNSGNSSEPHLHMHLMDRAKIEEGTGIKIYFEKVIIDEISEATNYSPVAGDRIQMK
jgi:murein DD-endopeptidase MepM/ murein hydrolase activator NlpD